MDAENAVAHDGRQAEVVKHLGAIPPHVDARVLAQALVVETENLKRWVRVGQKGAE